MEGIDYTNTFAHVSRMTTLRTLIALAVKNKWHLHQMDVQNAFLHGELNEEVFIKIPQGLTIENQKPQNKNMVCKLKKSLYGLKQASRMWFQKLNNALKTLGFKQTKSNYAFFTKEEGESRIIILAYMVFYTSFMRRINDHAVFQTSA